MRFVLFGFSLSTHPFISMPEQVCCFYLVAVYTSRNERNDFVCYSKILQHWVHCCVCREVREQFNVLTIHICIIINYLLFSCLSKTYGGGRAHTLLLQIVVRALTYHTNFLKFFFLIKSIKLYLEPSLGHKPLFVWSKIQALYTLWPQSITSQCVSY